MKLSGAIQEALLVLLAYDDTPGGSALVKEIVKKRDYDAFYQEVAEEIEAYIDRYSKPPGEHLLDIINSLCERKPDAESIYKRIFSSIQAVRTGINRAYVIDQAQAFARHQSIKRGIAKALRALEKDNAEGTTEAENALQASLERGTDFFDAGTFLSDAQRSLGFLNTDRSAFRTGIGALDKRGLGPARKRLHTFVALPGRGKSWWLVHLAKHGILDQRRVLYVTMELDEAEVSQRLCQSLFSVSKRRAEHYRIKFKRDQHGSLLDFKNVLIPRRPALSDRNIDTKLRELIETRLVGKPPILVKEFPAGELTPKGLDAYLDALEGHHGFIPDLVLLDYADEMSISSKDYRIELGQVYKLLRGIAQRRNIAVATASQANRSATRAKLITREHIGEDWSKIARSDTVITYTQTPGEHEFGLARLYVDKGRTDADQMTILISQNYAIGQFVMDNATMSPSYWRLVDRDTQKDDPEVDVASA